MFPSQEGGGYQSLTHSHFSQKASGGAKCSPREGAPEAHCGWRWGQAQASPGANDRMGHAPWAAGTHCPPAASGTPTRTRKAASHLGADPPFTWGGAKRPPGVMLGTKQRQVPWSSFVTSSSNRHQGISNGEPPRAWGTPPSDQPFQANFRLPLTAESVL